MDKLTLTKDSQDKEVIIEIDDSLNDHGSVGVDFWKVKNGGGTLMFALDFEETIKLTKYIIDYLAKTNNN